MRTSTSSILLLALVTLPLLAACRRDAGDAAARKAEAVIAQSNGLNALRRDELPEAEEEFKRVIELVPDDALGYANLGLTYIRAGRYAEAERQLERARDLAPNNGEVALMMAKLYSLTNRSAEAADILGRLPRGGADDARVTYALAELEAARPGGRTGSRYRELLRRVLVREPSNVAVRLELARLAAGAGEADSAVRHLEEVRRLPPEPPQEARPVVEEAIQLLRAGRIEAAREAIVRLIRIMELTQGYQNALNEVKWVDGPLVGRPVLSFEPQSLIELLGSGFRPGSRDTLRFVDVTGEAGLPDVAARTAPGALAVGDLDGDGTEEIFAGSRLYRVQRGFVADGTENAGLSLGDSVSLATFADFDNDGWLDLFAVTSRAGRLLRNTGTGRFEDVSAQAGPFDIQGAQHAAFVDLDHDGDLDLLLTGTEKRLVYRNNLDGTFTEYGERMGLAGRGDARSTRFADFDADGRIDIFISHADVSDALFRNLGGGRFADVSATSGIATSGGSGSAAIGDYDNDGAIDIFVASLGGEPVLWRNDGDGTFTRDRRSASALRVARGSASGATFVDVNNDGWLDLVVGGTPSRAGDRGLFLLRNDGSGRFVDYTARFPADVATATAVLATDVDVDGDQDILVGAGGGARLFRNEGGNMRMATKVRLNALRTGSGKNNTFGIGSRIELRAGEIYQTRTVTSRVTHFGLGSHLKADVLRIEWPNGVPQIVHLPGTDQDVLELEWLKGSCAFVYAWDGTGFRFVTDVMWRSALGMPLGIMGGGTTAYAPAQASQEYLRIPGSALQPRNGRYVLQFTEELWETAYADQIRLLAIDHPDSVDVFVDERFVPPAPVELRVFKVVRPRPPRTAVDERGRDVLDALRARDDVYVSNLTPVRYQGVVEPHALVLDLGDEAGSAGTFLFLRGWIYPTDASINVAISQQSKLKVSLPSLEVRDARGQWRTAIANIGFPSGKDKTIVVDLGGIFPTNDHRVRIRTNMQIYWDQAFVSRDVASAPVRIAELRPVAADLHFRGYSRTYRKGGRYGPHWFDYDEVSTEHPWRPIEGAFTRFGDVLPLLHAPDDQYVVMAPGDEATVEFDASSAALPPGWTRDFLLYTDGWIKDADMNTAFGNTVEPLPFHAIKQYPYAVGESYPTDSARQKYLRQYNTRIIRGADRRARLR
ncbi:MAG TPA: FG-GAP-like repeat-containing protein [Gemmatimonadaceae bacterium]|nr:FG-GAP-like repeat-containing protein [Gemmatimonadaceae bacterium]